MSMSLISDLNKYFIEKANICLHLKDNHVSPESSERDPGVLLVAFESRWTLVRRLYINYV